MRELNWVAKHQTDFNKEYDLLEILLSSSGVTDIDKFLNVNKSDIHDGMLLKNMDRGLTLLNKVLTENENPRIFVKVDSDVDGFTSSSYIMQFINEVSNHKANITFKISQDKTHGIVARYDIGDNKYDLIIIPDAGSENVDDCRIISEKGMPILILDHHIFNYPEINDYAVLINCTDGSYPNPTLSGVGVVHKFCVEYCKKYGLSEQLANNYLDLVAFGMIADSMDMRNYETRYYTLEGLKPENHKNLFLNELYKRSENELKFGRTIQKTGWTVAPKVNAIVRYGTEEEQIDTIRAMIGIKDDREYQPRRLKKDDPKPPIEIHSLQKTMARVCDNAKSRQDTDIRRTIEQCNEIIKEKKLDKNSIIVLEATHILPKNTITGLIANKIANIYKRPTLILTDYNEDIYGGSGRGYGKGSVAKFRTMLSDTGLFNKCAGHDNAFGILIDKKNIEPLIDICNAQIEVSDLVKVYEVDYEIKADNLKEHNINTIANAHHIWGNGVEEPVFAITDIHIPASFINGYTKENSTYIGFISFVYKGITFTKSYCAKTDYDELTLKDRHTMGKNKKNLKINIIGRFVLNEIDGVTKPQVVITDFQSVEDTDIPLDTEISKHKNNKHITEDFEAEIIKKPKRIEEDDFVF